MKEKTKIIISVIISVIVTLSITVTASLVTNATNITYTSDKTNKTNVSDSLDELYDMASSESNKKQVIYVGQLNTIPYGWNNGVITSTFDIKNIYEDYASLTIDNFLYKIERILDHFNNNPQIIGGNTLTKSYNATTGILTINNCYQINDLNSGFYGKFYLVIGL